jgi:4-hydroxy-4-methyl-2-oxoglutarate aldolase
VATTDPVPSSDGTMRADQDLDALLACGTATVHEVAGDSTVLPAAIVPIVHGGELCGPAFTVDCGPGDNLWIHRAAYLAPAGSVLVVSCSGDYEYGYWGEILSTAAAERNLRGVVIDGHVRDTVALQQVGLPVFARGTCVRGTAKRPRAGTGVSSPIIIGEALIRTGDIVIGDADGVICVPAERLDGLLVRATQRIAKERNVLDGLVAGGRSLELLGIDPQAPATGSATTGQYENYY